MEDIKTIKEVYDLQLNGDSELSVRRIFFKCKPNYIHVVTSFERAVNLFY